MSIGDTIDEAWEIFHEDIKIGAPYTQDVVWVWKIRYLRLIDRDSRPSGHNEFRQQYLNDRGAWVDYQKFDTLENPWFTFDGIEFDLLKKKLTELDDDRRKMMERLRDDLIDILGMQGA